MAETKKSKGGEPKRFYKSRKDKMIDGVCGGLAEYLGVDVTLVRVLWLLSIFLNGVGAVAYIVAMIVVPVNPSHKDITEEKKQKGHPAFYVGLFCIVLGFILLINRWDFRFYRWDFPWRFPFDRWWHIHWESIWPLALIALGVAYIIYIVRKDKDKTGEGGKVEKDVKSSTGRKLVRTPDDKMIAGVCGGIGRHFNVDSTLVRIGLVILAVATHAGPWVIAYIVLAIVLPKVEADVPAAK